MWLFRDTIPAWENWENKKQTLGENFKHDTNLDNHSNRMLFLIFLELHLLDLYTDYGHLERAFFQKLETFGLGQTNWAEILWGIWGISGQTVSAILALWVPFPWENVAGSLSYKKLLFLGLKHTTPKCSQNKILAVKKLGNSIHTSVFGGCWYVDIFSKWLFNKSVWKIFLTYEKKYFSSHVMDFSV